MRKWTILMSFFFFLPLPAHHIRNRISHKFQLLRTMFVFFNAFAPDGLGNFIKRFVRVWYSMLHCFCKLRAYHWWCYAVSKGDVIDFSFYRGIWGNSQLSSGEHQGALPVEYANWKHLYLYFNPCCLSISWYRLCNSAYKVGFCTFLSS